MKVQKYRVKKGKKALELMVNSSIAIALARLLQGEIGKAREKEADGYLFLEFADHNSWYIHKKALIKVSNKKKPVSS